MLVYRLIYVETKMLTSALRRLGFLILVMGLAAPTWSTCQAIGSFQTRPAFPDMARTDDPALPPTNTWPNLSASSLVGGCGRVASASPKHRLPWPGRYQVRRFPLAACFVSIQSNRDWIWALFVFGRRRPKLNSGTSCALLRHVDQTKSEERQLKRHRPRE